jgi:hypothetical protein
MLRPKKLEIRINNVITVKEPINQNNEAKSVEGYSYA